MKKYILISLVLLCSLFTSCWKEAVHVDDITLDTNSVTLVVGESFLVNASLSPVNADNNIIIWTSDNASVARVDDGTITAVAPGETTVHAKADDGGKTASCSVVVVSEKVPVTGVSISVEKEPVVIQKGETATLTAVVAPEDASEKSVRWSSTDEAVLTVSEGGVVTAVSAGEAEVIATTLDGGFVARCKILVERHAYGLTMSASELTIKELESKILTVTVDPEDAVEQLVWESSDPETAIVEYGVVRGLRAKADPVTIKARTEDSRLSATCQVTVTCDVKGVTLKDSKIQLAVGGQYKLEHVVYPTRATNQDVTWTSDNTEVVTVSEGGLVALKKGTAKITVTTAEGGFSATCAVEVVNNISGISIKPDSISLTEDESAQLEVVFNPAASGEQIKWSSSDERVATVSESGLVKAIGAGEAVICAVTDAGMLAYCKVNVSKMVDSIRLEPESLTLYLAKYNAHGSQQTAFKPVVSPEGSNVKLIWSSSDETVATVNASGNVTPVGPGTAVITASTANENPANRVTASGNVTVIQEVTAIEVTPASIEMWEGDTKDVTISFSPEKANANYRVQFDDSASAKLSFDKNTSKLTATAPGTTTMYIIPAFSYPQGLQKACPVKVLAHVHELKASGSAEVRMPIGGTLSLKEKVVFVPSDAANKKLVWSSDNTAVASVDENGVVSGIKAGSVNITATADDTYKGAKLVFSVKVCEKDITKITLVPLEVAAEESKQVEYTIEPADVYDSSLTWESTDAFVASVDQNGVVTGVKVGTAIIKATAKSGVSASCGVTVTSKVIHVTSVTLNKSALSLNIDQESTLVAQILPQEASNRNLEWTVEPANSEVVSLSPGESSCTVKALAEGVVTVKATTKDGGLSSSCKVTVIKPVIHVSSVSLNMSKITLAYGQTQTLKVNISPSNASDKSLTWTVDDESIATVVDGAVMAKSKTGTTTVHVASNDNKSCSASCVVEVVPKLVHVSGLSLETEDGATTLSLSVGQVKRVVAKITPEDATNKAINWSVQQGGVIFIDGGYVTANKAGTSRVFAETVDGGYTASMQVIVVENKPAIMQISYTSLTLKVGETFDLTAKLIGEDPKLPPTNGDVYWKSSSTSVATAAGGHITALTEGTATITVESVADSSVKATCQLTVIGSTSAGGSEGVEFDDWNF